MRRPAAPLAFWFNADMPTIRSDFFREEGYARLEGFHPPKRMMAIRGTLLDEIRRVTGRGGMARTLQTLPVFQQIGKLSSRVRCPGLHETLMTPELVDRIAVLAGRMPSAIQNTQLLLSPPRQGAWRLEGLDWHVDAKAPPGGSLAGIQAFFLVADVAPRGGATLALAGSHRIEPGSARAASLRDALRTAEGLERRLRELDISVVEMAGRAGDVFLMDMRLLHTPSINATGHIRMMATSRCFFHT